MYTCSIIASGAVEYKKWETKIFARGISEWQGMRDAVNTFQMHFVADENASIQAQCVFNAKALSLINQRIGI
jgi:hypothetical protein